MTRQQFESQAQEWAQVLAGLRDRACQQVRRWDILITSAGDNQRTEYVKRREPHAQSMKTFEVPLETMKRWLIAPLPSGAMISEVEDRPFRTSSADDAGQYRSTTYST